MMIAGRVRKVMRIVFGLVALAGILGLAVGATYSTYGYAVGARAVAHAEEGAPFRFVALGDVEDEVVGLEDLVGVIEERARPDFAVALGDIAKHHGRTFESYVAYFDLMRRLRPPYPVYTVPGNHDRPEEGGADEYAAAFGPRNWWFEHEDCVFVGIDVSRGRPSRAARAVMREASTAVDATKRVIVFQHSPVWGTGVEPVPDAASSAARVQRSLASMRSDLGVPIDVIVSSSADELLVERDELGTLHVCCGAEHGLGWPERSTPQVAALFTVTDDDVAVEMVRVPYRVDAASAVRSFVHLRLLRRMRLVLGPVPVWLATLLACLGCIALRPSRSRVSLPPVPAPGASVPAPSLT